MKRTAGFLIIVALIEGFFVACTFGMWEGATLQDRLYLLGLANLMMLFWWGVLALLFWAVKFIHEQGNNRAG